MSAVVAGLLLLILTSALSTGRYRKVNGMRSLYHPFCLGSIESFASPVLAVQIMSKACLMGRQMARGIKLPAIHPLASRGHLSTRAVPFESSAAAQPSICCGAHARVLAAGDPCWIREGDIILDCAILLELRLKAAHTRVV